MPSRVSSVHPRALYAIGLAAWIVAGTIYWLLAPPLGHDEAQYALAARDALVGDPPRWHYVSYGMNALAIPGLLLGGSEIAMRLTPLVVGLTLPMAAAHLARRLFDDESAAWLVLILAGTVALTRRSAQLLSDLPACTCLLIACSIAIDELANPRLPRWRLAWCAPWLAAAFYLRYGSAIPIAAMALAALLVCAPAILSRPLPVLGTALIFAVLLVPHLHMASEATGRYLGILRRSSDMVAYDAGQGLTGYFAVNPFTYYGIAVTPLAAIGLAAIAWIRDRRGRMLWLFAVATLLGLGLTTSAQSRYAAVPLICLALLGVVEVKAWVLRARRARVAIAVASISVAAMSLVITIAMVAEIARTARARVRPTLDAAAAIRRDTGGDPCSVLGGNTTVLEWYSGCTAVLSVTDTDVQRERVYIVRTGAKLGAAHTTFDTTLHATPKTVLAEEGALVVRQDPTNER